MTDIMDFIEEFEAVSPEARLELVDGKFLVGGRLTGSRWFLQKIIEGWGFESALAFAPPKLWYQALQIAFEIPAESDFQQAVRDIPEPIISFPALGSRV